MSHMYFTPKSEMLRHVGCLSSASQAIRAIITDYDEFLWVGVPISVSDAKLGAAEVVKRCAQYMWVDRSHKLAADLFGSVEAAQSLVDSLSIDREFNRKNPLTGAVSSAYSSDFVMMSVEVPVDLYRTNAQAHHILQCIRPVSERDSTRTLIEFLKLGIREDIALFLSNSIRLIETGREHILNVYSPFDQTPFNNCTDHLPDVVSRMHPSVYKEAVMSLHATYVYWEELPEAKVSSTLTRHYAKLWERMFKYSSRYPTARDTINAFNEIVPICVEISTLLVDLIDLKKEKRRWRSACLLLP